MADDKQFSIGPVVAVYPRLSTPDTKFDENGIYKADGAMPLEEAEPIMKELSAIFKAHTGKPPKRTENTMWVFEEDEQGEETGRVIFKMRVKNKIRKKDGKLWDRKPAQFDAQLRPIDVNIWGGSTYIVSVEVYEWVSGNKKGVSLQPLGVQVLDLVTGEGGPSADRMGFSKRDGYVAPEEDEDEGTDDGDQDTDDDGDDDAEDGDY